MLFALPLVATAAVSAQQQWGAQETSILENISDMPRIENDQFQLSFQPDAPQTSTVVLNQTGELQGRIATIDQTSGDVSGLGNLNIFFVRDGQIAYQTKTDRTGHFTIQNAQVGPYSFIATGSTGFAAYGVYITAYNGQNDLNFMEAAAVSPNFGGFQQILNENLPTQVADQIMESAELSTAQPAGVTGSNRIRLVNGKLHGQIVTLFGQGQRVQGTMVNLVQNGRRIADVEVDQDGNFTIPDLQPGIYDFVAVGHSGLAAIRFEAVGQDSPITQVSFTKSPVLVATSLNICLTCQQDNEIVDQSVDYAVGAENYSQPNFENAGAIEYAGQAAGCGCAAGGACGAANNYAAFGGGAGGGQFGGGAGGGRFGGGAGGGRFVGGFWRRRIWPGRAGRSRWFGGNLRRKRFGLSTTFPIALRRLRLWRWVWLRKLGTGERL
jgi:hypothetical protein